METTVKFNKENLKTLISKGFKHVIIFESTKDIIAFSDFSETEEIINRYGYSNYNSTDHRYTVLPLDNELQEFLK